MSSSSTNEQLLSAFAAESNALLPILRELYFDQNILLSVESARHAAQAALQQVDHLCQWLDTFRIRGVFLSSKECSGVFLAERYLCKTESEGIGDSLASIRQKLNFLTTDLDYAISGDCSSGPNTGFHEDHRVRLKTPSLSIDDMNHLGA